MATAARGGGGHQEGAIVYICDRNSYSHHACGACPWGITPQVVRTCAGRARVPEVVPADVVCIYGVGSMGRPRCCVVFCARHVLAAGAGAALDRGEEGRADRSWEWEGCSDECGVAFWLHLYLGRDLCILSSPLCFRFRSACPCFLLSRVALALAVGACLCGCSTCHRVYAYPCVYVRCLE